MRGLDSVRIRGDGRTAEMVTEQVGQRPVRAAPRGESRRAGKIILRDRRPLFLVVLTNVIRGHTVDGGRDLLPIAIVVEVGRRRAGDVSIEHITNEYAEYTLSANHSRFQRWHHRR